MLIMNFLIASQMGDRILLTSSVQRVDCKTSLFQAMKTMAITHVYHRPTQHNNKIVLNSLTAKLFNLNFHPLEVVSR